MPLNIRKQIILEQIQESQKIIYRNDIENLTFVKENNKHKQTEVKSNNEVLCDKLDLLFEELERLNNEDSSSPAVAGATVQSEL